MRLDEYQIANALIDTRLVMTSRHLASNTTVNASAFARTYLAFSPEPIVDEWFALNATVGKRTA
jgi:hypothetical protein